MSIDAKDPFRRHIEAIIKRPKDKYEQLLQRNTSKENLIKEAQSFLRVRLILTLHVTNFIKRLDSCIQSYIKV